MGLWLQVVYTGCIKIRPLYSRASLLSCDIYNHSSQLIFHAIEVKVHSLQPYLGLPENSPQARSLGSSQSSRSRADPASAHHRTNLFRPGIPEVCSGCGTTLGGHCDLVPHPIYLRCPLSSRPRRKPLELPLTIQPHRQLRSLPHPHRQHHPHRRRKKTRQRRVKATSHGNEIETPDPA